MRRQPETAGAAFECFGALDHGAGCLMCYHPRGYAPAVEARPFPK
jgi:hypothetical protein